VTKRRKATRTHLALVLQIPAPISAMKFQDLALTVPDLSYSEGGSVEGVHSMSAFRNLPAKELTAIQACIINQAWARGGRASRRGAAGQGAMR
jgi:hypothetical protein